MEEYRKSVNAQHAPQELTERTLERIREEEKLSASEAAMENILYERGQYTKAQDRKTQDRKNQYKKFLYRRFLLGAAGLAACLAIVAGVFMNRPRLTYNPVSDPMVRGGLPEEYGEVLTPEEYEGYLGIHLLSLLEEYPCSNSKIYVSYDEEGQGIQKDEGTFYLNVDDHTVILKISGSGLEVPEGLLTSETSDVNGITVYVGEEAESGKLFAAYSMGEIQYYLICNDMSKKQFEHLLKQLIREEV